MRSHLLILAAIAVACCTCSYFSERSQECRTTLNLTTPRRPRVPVILPAQYVFVGFNKGASGGTSHTFTLVSRGTGCSTASATGSITCTANSTTDVLLIAATGFSTGGTVTCSLSGLMGSTSNPVNEPVGTTTVCLFYEFSISSGSNTYSVSWGNVGANTTTGVEFSCSPACSSVTFDKDAAAAQASTSSPTPVTTPSITPTNTGELLLGFAYAADNLTHCNGTWTDTGTAIVGSQSCYILSSASGATSLSITDAIGTDSWSSIIGAFR